MKKSQILITALAVAAVFLLLAVPAVAAEDRLTDHIIKTTGYGESITTPDKVTINLGIETIDSDAAKAQSENTKVMNKVINALKAAGITDDNIKTSNYSMYSYEISEYNKSDKYKEGTTVYKVTNTVTVTSYNVSDAGKLIDTAINAGANKVNNLQFGLSNEKKKEQRNAAIVSAVKAARADADAVASALGVKVTGTGVVTLDQSYEAVSYPNVTMAKAAMAEDSAAGAVAPIAAPTQIEAGSLTTTATASIVFTY